VLTVFESLAVAVTTGVFGIISIVLGKRIDTAIKYNTELKAKEQEKAAEQRVRMDQRLNKLFEAFINEQRNVAVGFEGLNVNVNHIHSALKEMAEESRAYRVEIFRRLSALEQTTAKHEGMLDGISERHS